MAISLPSLSKVPPPSYVINNNESDHEGKLAAFDYSDSEDDSFNDDMFLGGSSTISASSIPDYTSYLDELSSDSEPLLSTHELKATTTSHQPRFITNLISTTPQPSLSPALSKYK